MNSKRICSVEAKSADQTIGFDIDSAFQGQEGLARIKALDGRSRPYTLAFVDVRMPPGWDGVETMHGSGK